MKQPKVAVFVTGQLRNASEHIDNWLSTAFKNCEPTFYFTIWNEVGYVDINRLYQRSLRTIALNNEQYVEVSDVGIYLNRFVTLENEIEIIKAKLSGAKFNVIEYKKEYLQQIGGLKITDDLARDTHPFWQSCIPIAYLNKLALETFVQEQESSEFDAFCRIQGETTFDSSTNIDWSLFQEKKNVLLTSPDSISPEYQLSIKFFAGSWDGFSTLMNAYYPSIKAWKEYRAGTAWIDRPIGERYLKKLAIKKALTVDYSVRTFIERQRMYPVNPCLKSMSYLKENWVVPNVIDISEADVALLKKWEESHQVRDSFEYKARQIKTALHTKVINKVKRNIRKISGTN